MRGVVAKEQEENWSTHYAHHVHPLAADAILQRVNQDHHTSAIQRRIMKL
jgi:hypothetical protein